MNLAKASFIYVDLERPDFVDVMWYQPNSALIRRRVALWDEFRPRSNQDDLTGTRGLIARNYRQLVLSYERKRDHETADIFHIGEMESKRKEAGSARLFGRFDELFNLYNAYRLLSNYGTGIWQAATVLLLMIVATAVLFIFAGFRPVGSAEVIRYVPAFRFPPAKLLADFAKAVLLSVSNVGLQRDRAYEPVGDWSHFVGSLSVIVIAGQVALVLLAIRRRFRR